MLLSFSPVRIEGSGTSRRPLAKGGRRAYKHDVIFKKNPETEGRDSLYTFFTQPAVAGVSTIAS